MPGVIALAALGMAFLLRWNGNSHRVSVACTCAIALGGTMAVVAGGYLRPLYDQSGGSFGNMLARIEPPGWMLVLLVVGVVLVVAREAPRVPAVFVWMARVVIAFGIGPLLLMPWLRYHWDSTGEKLAWLGGIGVVMLLTWLGTRIAAGRELGRQSLLLTSLSTAAVAVAAALSGSLFMGTFAGAIALAMGMTWIGWHLTARYLRAGVLDLAVILLMALVIYAKFYLDETFSYLQAALILATPMTAAVPRLKPLQIRHSILNAIVSLLLATALLASVVGIAVGGFIDRTNSESSEDSGGIDYGEMYRSSISSTPATATLP
jgi:hypothetical protein